MLTLSDGVDRYSGTVPQRSIKEALDLSASLRRGRGRDLTTLGELAIVDG